MNKVLYCLLAVLFTFAACTEDPVPAPDQNDQEQTENPGGQPGENPGEQPGENPGENPGQPGDGPGQEPSDPVEMPFDSLESEGIEDSGHTIK